VVLDLIVIKSDDGFTAEVPSVKGCESWAHKEEDVINKTLELIRFYLKIPGGRKILVDRARKTGNTTVYKLVFEKYL